MAEIEISIVSRQCLKQRLGDQAQLHQETLAWAAKRNKQKAMIHWCFDVHQARTKLARLYP